MKKFISMILVLTLLITTTNIAIPISAFAENGTSASAEIPILTEEAVIPEATTVEETETVDEEVTLELMEEKRVMLMSYGNATVTGKVVDSNGNGINKVSISVYDVTEQISIGLYYTGSNGTWTFDDAIQGNTYVFRYYHPLYDIANDTVDTTVEYASVSLPNATATKIYDEFTETDASQFTYSVINGLYINITGYTGNDSTVVIPNMIDGYTVQSIGSDVFKNNTTLTTVVLPENLESIGSSIFYNCTNLSTVVFNSSLKTIGSSAFERCTALTQARFPNGLQTIGSYAFENTKLTSVELPDGVTTINGGAFNNCSELQTFDYPIGWTTAGSNIFYNCTKLTNITVPEGTVSIPNDAFKGMSQLTNVSLPTTLTKIGSSAFESCVGLTKVEIPENVTSIGSSSFAYCTELKEISLPEGLLTIGSYAFEGCTALTTVVLPDTITTMNSGVFAGCTNLSQINYPKSWTTAGSSIFYNCTKLVEIEVPEDVTTIPNEAFKSANKLQRITLPTTLTKIGSSAFESCVGLTKVEIPENVTSIGSYAFEYCSGLKEISLPEGLLTIGSYAFEGCTALTAVVLPDTITTMNSGVFAGCTNLSQINYPKSWTTAGSSIFYNCTKLTSITVPEGVTTIPSSAFEGANKIRTVKLPESLTTIERYAFNGCTLLRSLSIPDKVQTIGYYAFDGCPKLIVYCNEKLPAISYIIDNNIQFSLTKEITSYDHFIFNGTDYYNTTNSVVGYVPFEVEYKTKNNVSLSDKEIVIRIPQNTELIESTLKVDGIIATNYEYDDMLLTIPVDETEGNITFCVKPIEYDALLTYAKMDFTEEGERKSETIGVVNCSVPTLTLKADDRTNSETVKVEGIAPPSTKVELYVDNTYVKSVTSIKSGKYSTTVAIPNPKNFNKYTITAKTSKDDTDITADATVMYEESAPMLKTLTMQHGSTEYNLTTTNGTKPNVVFNPSYGFKFSAKFDNRENLDDVYIVSTRNNQKKYMNTTWNSKTQSYVAEGRFEGTDNNYVPGEITVEYTKKRPNVPISNSINASELVEYMDESVKDCTTTVKTNTDTSYEATINVAEEISDLIGDEINFVAKTLDKEYNNIPVSDLMSSAENFYSYFIEEDGKKYVLNLDLTDPETLNMVVHDISGDKQLNYILDFMDNSTPGNPSKALAISEVLDQIGFVTGTIADVYDIENADEELRDKIMASGMTAEEREIALKKADELKRDREMFLLTTMVITVATMGAGGAPALVFGLLFGAVTTSSSFFWDMRMANILGSGTGFSCNWSIDPSGYVYEGITSNRLEGVTATAYWIAPEYIDENGVGDETKAVLWDASEYEQMNPLTTDANGQYAWDVPEGLWQVKFEKDGYETAFSEWLPVPPPQTEVHMGMISYTESEITSAEWDGKVLTVEFSKPIIPDTISNFEILDKEGKPLEYEVSFDETSTDLQGVNYCKVFVFTIEGEPSSVKGNSDVKSYANVGMSETTASVTSAEMYSQFDISTKTATVRSSKEYSKISVYAASYENGKLISLKSKTTDLAVGDTTVTFDELDLTNADTVKIMVWESASSIKPICGVCVVEIE